MAEVADFIRRNPFFTKTRIPSLYSNFSHLKELNPDGYDANIEAWGDLLTLLLNQGILPSSILNIPVEGPSLPELLKLPVQGSPKGLETVLNELVDRRILIPFSHYRAFRGPFNGPSSLKNFIFPSTWLLWGILAFRGPFKSSKLAVLVAENYISWENLTARGQHILLVISATTSSSYSNGLFDTDLLLEFIRKNCDSRFSSADLLILLIHFVRDLGVAITRNAENTIFVKFGEKSPISDDDIAIIKIEASIRKISLRNSTLEHKLQHELPSQIGHILQQKHVDENTTKARLKGLLAHKRALSASLARASDVLARLETVLLKINDASTNVDAFRILKQSSGVLKTLNEMVNVDEVDELQAQLDEELGRTEEISQSMVRNSQVDDDELEQELKALYSQEAGKEVQKDGKKEGDVTKEDGLLKKLETLSVQDDEIADIKAEVNRSKDEQSEKSSTQLPQMAI